MKWTVYSQFRSTAPLRIHQWYKRNNNNCLIKTCWPREPYFYNFHILWRTARDYDFQQHIWQKNWITQIGNWNSDWNEKWWDQIWQHLKNRIPWHENIINQTNQTLFFILTTINQTFFVLWTTIHWSHEMATLKIILQIFTCIKIYQTFSFPEPWRRHYNSISKVVGWH